MQIKAVIFDRDGVLTYFDLPTAIAFFQPLLPLSLLEIAEKWRQRGEQVGFPRTLSEEITFFSGFWDALSDELGLAQEIRQQLQQFDYTTCLRPYPDARPALLEARQLHLRTAVLSNFSLASLQTSLAAVHLADLVEVACAATVIGAAKPAAAAYLTVCEQLGLLPEECLFFDDEVPCVEGARAIGMQAFLVERERAEPALVAGIVCDLSVLRWLIA